MRSRTLLTTGLAVTLTAAVSVAGCSSSELVTAIEPVTAIVKIGPAPVEFRVEIAQTADQQRDGLSGRESVPPDTGMLFRFGSRSEQQVWMAGMNVPLDIAWIVDGRVLAVDTLSPCSETDQDQCPLWTSPSPATALLEVPADSLTTVIPGMPVTIEEQSS